MNKKFDLQLETAKLYGYDERFSNASGPSAANIITDVLRMERNLDSGSRARLEKSLEFIQAGNVFGASAEIGQVILTTASIPDNSEAHVLLQAANRMLSEAPPSPSSPPFDLQKEQSALWGYSQ